MGGDLKPEDVLVPLEDVTRMFGVSRRTIELWARADGIQTYQFPGSKQFGTSPGKAIRWGDIEAAHAANPNRWVQRA